MDLAAALRAGSALPYRRPTTVLPYYLLAASAPAVARVPAVLGAGAALAWLAATGRLDPVVGALRDADLGLGEETEPSPGVGPGIGEQGLPPDLTAALGGLVTPTTVALVGTGLAAALVCLLVARAVTAAGALAAAERALAGEEPLAGGARGMARHWRSFLGLAVVRAAARIGAAGAGALAVGVAAAGVSVGGAAAVGGVLAGLAGGAAVLVGVVAVELVTAFAGAAVVVDRVGAGPALRRGAGLATDRPKAFLGYAGVVAVALVGGGICALVLAVAGAPRLLGVVTALLVAPVLDGVRVALYAERGPEELPAPTAAPRARAAKGLRDGVAALGRFVRDHPVANLGGAAALAAGGALGWLAVAPYRLSFSPPAGEAGAVFGAVPVGPFLNIAANNWLVAAGTGYGGLALGLPAATALLFNGALLGVVAGAVDPVVVAALVAPHGVVELPAIAVAGGLGFHLGGVGWAALRGRRDATAVGDALREALRVLVGLGVVLVVASAIETVVTPRVAAAVLG
jgi:uncharacterized membrane protein SpoIIM required for sporulation